MTVTLIVGALTFIVYCIIRFTRGLDRAMFNYEEAEDKNTSNKGEQ